MKSKKAKVKRKGSALLVVLFIVMAITILSLGFLSRSDVELACGENMILKTQMDYLAESGLEHARGLIINPQEIASGYWPGAAEQQLVDGSNDYYDVNVVKDVNGECNYRITCDAYRRKNGEKIGQSSLTAELRLNPCIALWTGVNTTLWSGVTIHGDVNCGGTLLNEGTIDGDVFILPNSFSGIKPIGQKYKVADLSLAWPPVTTEDFILHYAVQPVAASLFGQTFGPYDPVRICYNSGDVQLAGNVRIEGMLMVGGDLRVQGTGNVINAGKNLPAIFVKGDMVIENGCGLDVSGLVVVDGRMNISAGASNVSIAGGLFVGDGITETTIDSSGNGIIGTLYNGTICQGSGGQVDGAFKFDGVNDYVQTSNSTSLLQLTGDYTLSVWIKADASQNIWAGIFSKCDPSGSTNHWTLQFDSSSPRKLIIYHPSGIWETGIQLNNVAGAWHHVRIVRSGSTMKSYLDSVEIKNNTWVNNPGSGNGHLNIGADRTASSNYVYKGLIDDIRIYNRAPAVGETYPSSGLVGHWKLDEGGSSISITAAPEKTAIVVWSQTGAEQKWSSAAGAFFRSIKRK